MELESTLTPRPRLSSRTARLRQPGISVALAGPCRRSGSRRTLNGHWFIGPVPADDIVVVRQVRGRTRGYAWCQGRNGSGSAHLAWSTTIGAGWWPPTQTCARVADWAVKPRAVACWDDLEVPVTYDGEPWSSTACGTAPTTRVSSSSPACDSRDRSVQTRVTGSSAAVAWYPRPMTLAGSPSTPWTNAEPYPSRGEAAGHVQRLNATYASISASSGCAVHPGADRRNRFAVWAGSGNGR